MNTPSESFNGDSNANLTPVPQSSKKTLFVAVAFILVIVLAVAAYVLVQNKKTSLVGQSGKGAMEDTNKKGDNPEAKPTKVIAATKPPTVQFDKWTFSKKMTNAPTSALTYSFKQGYTEEDVQALGKKLNSADNLKKDKTFIISYTMKDNNKDASLLTYSLLTGNLSYASTTGVALPAGATVEGKVTAFLQSVNLYDDTLKATAQYKKKSKPGMTYIEIHRDWVKAGFPILNSIGLLNLPENVSLSTLALTTPLTNLPEDADIYATTDNKNGFTRQTDFNTMTVVVSDKTGKLMGLQSNIRQLATPPTKNTALISYDDAVTNLQNGKYDFILTTPSGTGDMPWDKVYPNNKAVASQAVVTDNIIAYLEQPSMVNQKELMPYYIFRGYANLLSGYRVNFVASVPAASAMPQSRNMFQLVKEVNAQETGDTTQKQGTFETTPGAGATGNTSATNNNSSATNPIPQTGRNAAGVCAPSSDDLNPVLLVGGLKFGWANWRIWGGKQSTSKDGFWYYIPEPGTTDAVVIQNLDQIIALLQSPNAGNVQPQPTNTSVTEENGATSPSDDTTQKQGTFNITPKETPLTAQDVTAQELVIRQQNKILKDLGLLAESCPVRLTGASPSIFVYGAEGSAVKVTTGAELTYADPVTSHEQDWNVVVHANGLTVNGYNRPYIYYEYKPVAFSKPAHGWVVAKDQLSSVVSTVSKGLGLTDQETQRALFELNHAASSVSSGYVYVSLVQTNELAQRVPLTVSPQPDHLYRYHFYVTAAQKTDRASAPQLSPVVRSGLTVLEIGSAAQ